MGVAGFATWAKLGVENVQTAATASQMLVFDRAAQQYVQDHAAALVAATVSSPVTIAAATLVNLNYLPQGFSVKNPFGQVWQLQVSQPSAGQLQPLVTSQAGTPISDTKQLVQIAAQAGAQGGFVPYPNQAGDATMTPASAHGAYGGWVISLANYLNPGSGHLASLLSFTSPQANNNYLYRVSVTGQPQLNRMQTTLDMNANDISNANNVAASSVSVGQASLSYDQASSQLDVKANGGEAVTNAAGTAWAPLTAGNISSGGSISSTGNVYSGGAISSAGDIDSGGNVNTNGRITANGDIGSYGDINGAGTVSGAHLQPNAVETPGARCWPPGEIATSGNGPLFCQAGVWASSASPLKFGGSFEVVWVGNDGGNWAKDRNDCWQANPLTGNCTCPSGYNEMLVGMTYHYQFWDGAGFVCWASA